MKIKQDFVTNSSSTSFCGWGIGVDANFDKLSDDMKKLIYNVYVEMEKRHKNKYCTYEEFLEDPDEQDWLYVLDDVMDNLNLKCEVCFSNGYIYIGLAPNQIPENKTILEVKNETKQKLQDLGFDVSDFGYILESWYD